MAYNTRADRAKIFAPFDALKGLNEALEEKEHLPVYRTELSEDKKEELDALLCQLSGHPVLTVVFYSIMDQNYLSVSGTLTRLSYENRTLQIDQIKIAFPDIIDITVHD